MTTRTTTYQGTVLWFRADKGYGFIGCSLLDKDVFVHHTGILMEGYRTLLQGAVVEFDLAEGRKGLQAVNVRNVG